MTRQLTKITPRLLSLDMAAEYCGLSPETFEATVPVRPIDLGIRRKLWDIRALDRWLDEKSGLIEISSPTQDWLGKLRSDRSRERR